MRYTSPHLIARLLGFLLMLVGITAAKASETAHTGKPDLRIGFGSCSHQDKPQPIWQAVLADKPDLFLFLGDNIYGDSDDPAVLERKYQKLGAIPGFKKLRASTPIMATWDDHDYGQNDIGRDYVSKEASRKIMLDFWQETPESPRYSRPDGIYTSRIIEDQGKRVQIILLDLRWNRTDIVEESNPLKLAARYAKDQGPYEAILDPDATMLGTAQWQGIENQFQETAELRLIGSSIQAIAEFTGWETWANFPHERRRLIELINGDTDTATIILSGDVHWSELSVLENPQLKRPIVELTSSGLTEKWKAISPNRHRLGKAYAEPNYGLVDIYWGEKPKVKLGIYDVQGAELLSYQLDI